MAKYHITKKGKVAKCKATIKPCPLGGEHITADNKEEAQKEFDKILKKENTILPNNVNIFWDMDGVLAKWKAEDFEGFLEIEDKEKFFTNLEPARRNIEAARILSEKYPNSYILTALFESPEFPLEDAINTKDKWADKYIDFISKENRIFVPPNTEKIDFIKDKLNIDTAEVNILIDDYSRNIIKWEADGNIAIKMDNSLNNKSNVDYKHNIKSDNPSMVNVNYICNIVENNNNGGK